MTCQECKKLTFQDLIDNSGKSLSRLTNETGINRMSIGRWYKGETDPSSMTVANLVKLAQSLGVEPEALLRTIPVKDDALCGGWARIDAQTRVYVEDDQILYGERNGRIAYLYASQRGQKPERITPKVYRFRMLQAGGLIEWREE